MLIKNRKEKKKNTLKNFKTVQDIYDIEMGKDHLNREIV
jgi:hypothetical protein